MTPVGDPVADRVADKPSHVVVHAHSFDSQVSATVPAGGTATYTSPPLGYDIRQVRVTVKSEDEEEFERMAFYLSHKRLSKGKKLQTCTRMHRLALQVWRSTFIDYEL